MSVIKTPVVLQCDPNPLVTSAIYKNLGLEELYGKKWGLRATFMLMQGGKKEVKEARHAHLQELQKPC